MATGLPSPIAPETRSVILTDLSLGYGGRPVVEHVTGAIGRGSMLALVGPNGAGKSTLLRALAGLHRPSGGTLHRGLAETRPAYLPQHGTVDQAFPMSVRDFVAMGLWREIGLWRPLGSRRSEKVLAALAQVGLGDAAHQRIGTLSGGQMRRALFARASLQDASLVLLDEPFAGIDTATARELMRTITLWHTQGRTIVAALHDLDQVGAHFPQTLLLARRVIAWGDTAAVLSPANNAVAFGQPAAAHV